MITYPKLTKAQHVLLKVTVRDYVNILFRVCLFSRIRQHADKIREQETCDEFVCLIYTMGALIYIIICFITITNNGFLIYINTDSSQ